MLVRREKVVLFLSRKLLDSRTDYVIIFLRDSYPFFQCVAACLLAGCFLLPKTQTNHIIQMT